MVVVWRPHYQVSKEVINMERNEVNHSAYSTWRCQYHIVFAPKFRRKAIYGQLKADIGQILRKLCEEKKVEIIEAEACADHIHRLVSIPPQLSVLCHRQIYFSVVKILRLCDFAEPANSLADKQLYSPSKVRPQSH